MAKDSKTRYSNYKSAALPAELCRHLRGKTFHSHSLFSAIVSPFVSLSSNSGCNGSGFRSAADRVIVRVLSRRAS